MFVGKKMMLGSVFVVSVLVLLSSVGFCGSATEPLGVSVCSISEAHCSDCWSLADRTVQYSWSSAPIEPYEQEYTKYYVERRCRPSEAVSETIHESYSIANSKEEAHTFSSGINTGIVIDKVFSLSTAIGHQDSLTFTCNQTHTHDHDWTLNYTKPQGQKGYFLHNYVVEGSDVTMYVSFSCVNQHSGHPVLHAGTYHGRTGVTITRKSVSVT